MHTRYNIHSYINTYIVIWYGDVTWGYALQQSHREIRCFKSQEVNNHVLYTFIGKWWKPHQTNKEKTSSTWQQCEWMVMIDRGGAIENWVSRLMCECFPGRCHNICWNDSYLLTLQIWIPFNETFNRIFVAHSREDFYSTLHLPWRCPGPASGCADSSSFSSSPSSCAGTSEDHAWHAAVVRFDVAGDIIYIYTYVHLQLHTTSQGYYRYLYIE